MDNVKTAILVALVSYLLKLALVWLDIDPGFKTFTYWIVYIGIGLFALAGLLKIIRGPTGWPRGPEDSSESMREGIWLIISSVLALVVFLWAPTF